MARRILIHVGCPKTGTSFLQGVLWANRDALAEQGLLVPLTYHHHFRASLVVRDAWRRRSNAESIEQAWHELLRAVHETDGDVLITHESLAAAAGNQARFAIDAFDGAEVHVLVTARDLARQLPAEWQQSVKQGSVRSFADFVQAARDRGARSRWFWLVQDVPDIVRRWGAELPAERTHVITVPQRGSDASTLWARFASVLGVDPAVAELRQTRSNQSLGTVEVELLRRVNECRDERFPIVGNQRWFKDLLANNILARRPGKERFSLSADAHAWVCEASRRMVAELGELGCDVVGDLQDLVPPPAPAQGADPAQVRDESLVRSATESLLDLLDVHRERVEWLEHWRDLAVRRGDRIVELENQLADLEHRRLRMRGGRAVARLRENARRRLS